MEIPSFLQIGFIFLLVFRPVLHSSKHQGLKSNALPRVDDTIRRTAHGVRLQRARVRKGLLSQILAAQGTNRWGYRN